MSGFCIESKLQRKVSMENSKYPTSTKQQILAELCDRALNDLSVLVQHVEAQDAAYEISDTDIEHEFYEGNNNSDGTNVRKIKVSTTVVLSLPQKQATSRHEINETAELDSNGRHTIKTTSTNQRRSINTNQDLKRQFCSLDGALQFLTPSRKKSKHGVIKDTSYQPSQSNGLGSGRTGPKYQEYDVANVDSPQKDLPLSFGRRDSHKMQSGKTKEFNTSFLFDERVSPLGLDFSSVPKEKVKLRKDCASTPSHNAVVSVLDSNLKCQSKISIKKTILDKQKQNTKPRSIGDITVLMQNHQKTGIPLHSNSEKIMVGRKDRQDLESNKINSSTEGTSKQEASQCQQRREETHLERSLSEEDIRPQDVLCGKSTKCRCHEGNRKLLKFIFDILDECKSCNFLELSETEIDRIIALITLTILSNNGRFLRQIENDASRWRELTAGEIQRKVHCTLELAVLQHLEKT